MLKRILIRNKFFLPIITIPIILSFIGLIFIFEASSIRSLTQFSDSFHYIKLQFGWFVLALGLMFFFSRFDYKKLYFFSFLAMIVTILLLIVVLIPGLGFASGGARRWIDFGVINVQPTEIAKFSIIIYLSSWFTNHEKRRFFSFLCLIGLMMFLIILQPDMGTAMIVFSISMVMYYLSGMNLLDLLVFLPIFGGGIFLLIKTSPYRLNRLLAYLNPTSDPQGIGYHINQILISLSNGGLIGGGLGTSKQKYLFLPEAHTDSIFAIISEEYGFIGGLLIIGLYFVFVYKIYHLIRLAPDRLSRLMAGGIFAFFNLQVIINLAGMTGVFPLTGVPLPFLSYGGSNLLISYILIGILLNVEKRIHI